MRVLSRRRDLEGETVLVTAGPTVEDIDPVRFVSNRSSGRMGYRIAEAARDRGARVILVSGPTSLPAPGGLELVGVRSAEDMANAVGIHARGGHGGRDGRGCLRLSPGRGFSPEAQEDRGATSLDLVRTPDILRGLGEAKGGRTSSWASRPRPTTSSRTRARSSPRSTST